MPALNWILIIQGTVAAIIAGVAKYGFNALRKQTELWGTIKDSFPDIAKNFPEITKEIREIKELLGEGQKWMEREGARLDSLEKRFDNHIKNHNENNLLGHR